ncbi:MAG: hypothetical protein Q4F17_00515 [Eubacteriales bacterium]|nr:hypothetical protein [Eubacteriales bacterium]
MKKTRNHRPLSVVAASFAACIILLGSAATAYAADVGGIQRKVQLWLHGDQTQAVIEFDGSGNYEMEYTDGEGNVKQQGGGGVAYDGHGRERPLTEEELLELLSDPEVQYRDDGTVWVYWFDQKIEITDKFEDGVCYVKLDNGEKTLYMTVKYQNGYATDTKKFVSPWEFN